jgi:hypothetical protein
MESCFGHAEAPEMAALRKLDGPGRNFEMRILVSAAIALLFVSGAFGTETVTYTYDAKGRLIRVVRTGTVNNNVTTDYKHDKANNRKTVVTTNSPNPPPP